ncbi:MAG: type II toxin-antitoxin system Phd/YefM family antitoxin [Oscillospiraceae bacterium]
MPQIIPIRDLKNTTAIAELCHQSTEPVFITKNGYGNMVIMSMDTYERNMLVNAVLEKAEQSEQDIAAERVHDAKSSLAALRGKYGI